MPSRIEREAAQGAGRAACLDLPGGVDGEGGRLLLGHLDGSGVRSHPLVDPSTRTSTVPAPSSMATEISAAIMSIP